MDRREFLQGSIAAAAAAIAPAPAAGFITVVVTCSAVVDRATYAVFDDQPQIVFRFEGRELKPGDRICVATSDAD